MTRLLGGIVSFGFAVFLTALSAHADDDVLYWMMSGTESMTDENGQKTTVSEFLTASGGSDFSARVRVTGGGVAEDTFLNLYYYDGSDFVLDDSAEAAFQQSGGVWSCSLGEGNLASVGAYSSGSPEYSFVIELGNVVNEEWTQTLATSSTMTYQSLADAGFISQTFDVSPPVSTMWNGGAFTAIPEPTSGMLMLMGLALLSLRRKRAADGV